MFKRVQNVRNERSTFLLQQLLKLKIDININIDCDKSTRFVLILLFISLIFLNIFIEAGSQSIFDSSSYKRISEEIIICSDNRLWEAKFKEQRRRRIPLSIGVLLPESYKNKVKPSIELALSHVHSTPNLLPDYCLQPIYKDTQVFLFSFYLKCQFKVETCFYEK